MADVASRDHLPTGEEGYPPDDLRRKDRIT